MPKQWVRPKRLILILAAFGWAGLMLSVGRAMVLAGPPASLMLGAPCTVSGFVVSDTTWSAAGCDPYIITGGNVAVQSGVTLTILPGTTIKLDSQLALSVQGTLIARGTPAEPITFTSNLPAPGPGDWGYLYFANTSADALYDTQGTYIGGSILQYAVLQYAGGANTSRNAALRIDGAGPFIDHNLIQNNRGHGVWTWNGATPRLTYNVMQRNQGGMVAGSGSTLMHNQFVSNTINTDGGGLYILGTVTASHNTVMGNVAGRDGGGIYVRGSNPISYNVIVSNSAGSSGGGLFVRSGSKPAINQNDIYSNTSPQGAALYNDNGSSGSDVNAEYNYWGTADRDEIELEVYHFIDDSALGIVDYEPFLGASIIPPPAVATAWLPLFFNNYTNYFKGPWEVEDNDAYTQANGPLQSGVAYLGHPDDAKDYFSIYLSQPGQITIDRLPDSGVGSGVQVILFYQSIADVRAVSQIPPYHIDYTGPAGWYYIYLYTASDYSSTAVYTLTVTYP